MANTAQNAPLDNPVTAPQTAHIRGCFDDFTPHDAALPFVIAQLGQSLDGRIATLSGESKYINHMPALTHLHTLRARVDAVLIGINTLIADDPQLNVRHVVGKNPDIIILDPSGRLPKGARCLEAQTTQAPRRFIIRDALIAHPDRLIPKGVTEILLNAPPHLQAGAQVSAHPATQNMALERAAYAPLDPGAILLALKRHGIERLLVEGGATTIARFINAKALDRLHLLIAPVILGSGKMGLDLNPITSLSDAIRPATETYFLGCGEVLFDCDFRATQAGAST